MKILSFCQTFAHRLPFLPILSSFIFLLPSSLASSELRASALNPALVSTGIKNLGNTCYMNAQLQCAFHIPLVRRLAVEPKLVESVEPNEASLAEQEGEALQTEDEEEKKEGEIHEEAFVKSSLPSRESDAKIALRELFSQMIKAAENPNLPAVVPRSFCTRLGIPPMVQQDSQEFWKLLLPAINEEPFSNLYKGIFEDYISALDGSGRERRREELFLDLSLDVGESSSLMDSLRKGFGEPELLSVAGGNGWRPEKGADKVDAHKGSSLIAPGLPPILQFHLKRFNYDWQTDKMSKLNSRLSFPLELDMSTICKPIVENEESIDASDSAEENDSALTKYDLQSIVVHVGEDGMGHYYAYVRPDVRRNIWYRFNDDIVERVSQSDVFNDAFGGMVDKHDTASEENSFSGMQGEGFFKRIGRLLRTLGSSNGRGESYGWGGSSSSAYVLQYVRRKDHSLLYTEMPYTT